MVKDRRKYHRWYNRVVRGRGEPKTRHRFKCAFCGFYLPSPDRAKSLYPVEMRVQVGFKYINPLDNPNLKSYYKKMLSDYKKALGLNALKYLNLLVSEGLMTKEEITNLLGLSVVPAEYSVKRNVGISGLMSIPKDHCFNVERGFNG